MITKEQALQLSHNQIIHQDGCKIDVGPRGGKKFRITQFRVASQVKTWKTRPNDFEFTVRFGMQSQTYIISTVRHNNPDFFHLESDCPLNIAAQEFIKEHTND